MQGLPGDPVTVIKPRTPPGVMELLPREQIAFQRMLDVVRRNFERFGFLPVETPVFELSEMLLTKTGGETERQVYFVQSTGALNQAQAGDVPELALRFDLTVPLARYVAEHEHELAFPFRRYQIQRVYRGERAQRGRFREFYQCDIDVIGKDSLSVRCDAEIPATIHAVFSELAIGPFTIHLNNRKLLRGFFESVGVADEEQQALVLREIDKLDKRGADHVRKTLVEAPFELSEPIVDRILDFVAIRSSSHEGAMAILDKLIETNLKTPATHPAAGTQDVDANSRNFNLVDGAIELREVIEMLRDLGVPESDYAVNFSIARGLDYYTGTVYETTLDDYPQIGSICSGGRYENLAGHYSKSKLPGVGISIGATRLFYQLREAGILKDAQSTVQALVGLMDDARLADSLHVAAELRAAGINTEVQLEAKKLAKQFQYADRAGIRFMVLVGEDEAARGVATVKDLRSQSQSEVPRAQLAQAIKAKLEQDA
jgi:histidyl-tRNA synthetase